MVPRCAFRVARSALRVPHSGFARASIVAPERSDGCNLRIRRISEGNVVAKAWRAADKVQLGERR